MARMMVLIRHGRAEERSQAVDDGDRTLTPIGIRALERSLPSSLAPLEGKSGIVVWTSPAVRARQTASIAASVLGGSSIEEHPSLAAPGIDGFLGEFAAADPRIVVAVGHDPFVEDVVRCLCSASVPFGKGAVAAIRVGDDVLAALRALAGDGDPAPGGGVAMARPERAAGAGTDPLCDLLWFVQAPRIGPWKTVAALDEALSAAAHRVEGCVAAFFDDPEDPETLHALRVSIRTLRSLLAFASPFQKKKQGRRCQDDLRAMVRQTSRLREYDVLVDQVAELEAEDPAASAEGASLLDEVRALREGERARVLRVLASKKMSRRLRRTVSELDGIAWKGGIGRDGLRAERLRERFADMLGAFEEERAAVDYSDEAAAHALRKHAKQVRYIAHAFESRIGPSAQETVASMKALQDELGALCDARVALAIIASIDAGRFSDRAWDGLVALRTRQERTAHDIESGLEAASSPSAR